MWLTALRQLRPRPLRSRPGSEQVASTPREKAAPAHEGSETEVGYRKRQLPWNLRRTGWWNPCACKSCGPGMGNANLELTWWAEGREVAHVGNPGVVPAGAGRGAGPYEEPRLGLSSRFWEMAHSCVHKLCEVLVRAVLAEGDK